MNFLDYQQALFIVFNPVLLLLLGIWLAVGIVSALAGVAQDAVNYVAQRWGRR